MLAVYTDFFATFAAGGSGLVGREFVGFSFLVGRSTPFAGNLPLSIRVHRGKASISRIRCLHS
jgi:hypothetical protein